MTHDPRRSRTILVAVICLSIGAIFSSLLIYHSELRSFAAVAIPGTPYITKAKLNYTSDAQAPTVQTITTTSFVTTTLFATTTAAIEQNSVELLPGPPIHVAYGFNETKHYELCAVTKVQNEAHTFPEWIEYHRHLGFQQFFVFEDCSMDQTIEVLRNYSSIGLVSYLSRQEGCDNFGQDDFRDIASDLVFHRAKPQCDFIASFDIDEFITRQNNLSQLSFLDYLREHNYARMPWYSMGHDGRIMAPQGLITKNYFRGGYARTKTPALTKMAVRSSIVLNWPSSHFPTRVIPEFEPARLEWLAERIPDVDYEVVDGVEKIKAVWYIKHYIARSLTEYLAKRISRPRIRDLDPNIREWRDSPMWYWHQFNLTEYAPDQEFTKEFADLAEQSLASRPWNLTRDGRFLYVDKYQYEGDL